jgi:hypothetical protein
MSENEISVVSGVSDLVNYTGDVALTEADMQVLNNATSNISKSFKDAQIFRTSVEFEVSVLNDVVHPTPDSKYWQCHMELKVHSNELILMNYDIQLKQLDLEELELTNTSSMNDIDKRRHEIEKNKIRHELHIMTIEIKDRIREVKQINEQMIELKDKCVFSTEDKEQHQLFSLLFRYAREYKFAKNAMGTTAGEKRNMIGHLVTTYDRVMSNPNNKELLKRVIPPDVAEILTNELLPNKEKER